MIPRPSHRISLALAGFFLLAAGSLLGADLSNYRGFAFGATISTTANVGGANLQEPTIVHQEPELIQELVWRPSAASLTDPVKDGLLGFFNGRLYRIVANYDRYKVEGMTAEDMIAALSTTYGPATAPDEEIPYRSIYGGTSALVIARWEDPDYEYNLLQIGRTSSFALVLTDKTVDWLARNAILEAERLDVIEAPLRALELQKGQEREERIRLEELRTMNQKNFRP